jgi:hypothetical protein
VSPLGPCGPVGIVKFKVCVGEVPVIEAAAFEPATPVVTVPIDKTFDGPGPPIMPSIPRGNVRFKVCVGEVPVIEADAGVEASTVVTVPMLKVLAGPGSP